MSDTARTIVVTGASRGIGQALAHEFVRSGHRVFGCSRSGSNEGSGIQVDPVDISDSKQVFEWAQTLASKDQTPDILVCNAAVINEPAPLWKVPPAEFDKVIAVNVLGMAYTLQAFIPHMIACGRGMIVAFSSGWGRYADPEMAPYCCSKFAVEGLTLSLAKELPEALGAVTLSPGIVQTDMLRKCWGERAAEYQTPEEWAVRAASLMLNLSPADNGAQLAVPDP